MINGSKKVFDNCSASSTPTWGSAIEPPDKKTPINWTRKSALDVTIKFEASDIGCTIVYGITDFVGAYNSKHLKLTEKGKRGFWIAPESLYKITLHNAFLPKYGPEQCHETIAHFFYFRTLLNSGNVKSFTSVIPFLLSVDK